MNFMPQGPQKRDHKNVGVHQYKGGFLVKMQREDGTVDTVVVPTFAEASREMGNYFEE